MPSTDDDWDARASWQAFDILQKACEKHLDSEATSKTVLLLTLALSTNLLLTIMGIVVKRMKEAEVPQAEILAAIQEMQRVACHNIMQTPLASIPASLPNPLETRTLN